MSGFGLSDEWIRLRGCLSEAVTGVSAWLVVFWAIYLLYAWLFGD